MNEHGSAERGAGAEGAVARERRRDPDPAGQARPAGPGDDEASVVRAFVRENRVIAMPARAARRLVLLRYLRDRCFAEDRVYTEREVSERLASWHEDFAALRRYLVDAGLMTRDHGEYRRGAE